MLVLMGALWVLLPMALATWMFSLALLGMTLLGTAAVSALSYALIEKPFQDLGKRLTRSAAPALVSNYGVLDPVVESKTRSQILVSAPEGAMMVFDQGTEHP